MLESKVAFAPSCTASRSTLVVLCATNRSREREMIVEHSSMNSSTKRRFSSSVTAGLFSTSVSRNLLAFSSGLEPECLFQ
jgi:hypothetical protein